MTPKRKLRLDPGTLKVELFPTSNAAEVVRGTVQAHQSSPGGDCPTASWSGPVNCFCCGSNDYDTQCCYTDPLYC